MRKHGCVLLLRYKTFWDETNTLLTPTFIITIYWSETQFLPCNDLFLYFYNLYLAGAEQQKHASDGHPLVTYAVIATQNKFELMNCR